LSRDSQGRVLKLSQFGLPGLCEFITLCSDLWLGWGLKQTYSSPWELSNGVSHLIYAHRGRVDSQLLVVGSQTASLTPGPFFCHKLCCKCPNGSCETIFDIYTSINFQWHEESFKERCFDPLQSNSEFLGVPEDSQVPISGVSVVLTLFQKWGCDKLGRTLLRIFW
jgi:hypothetical protein